MADEHKNLGQRLTRGAAWMSSIRVVMRLIGLLNMVILARLLVPEDFGTVAMAMIIIGLLDSISNFSFGLALIRDQKAGRGHYDTVWTLGVIRGIVLAILLLLLADPVAAFFDAAELTQIIYFLAALTFIEGFRNSGVINFHKDLRFDKEFRFVVGRKVATFAATVVLAIVWRNYWALVGGIAVGRVLAVILSYTMQPYRPRFSLSEWHDLFHFSKWLLIKNIIGAVTDRMEHFIVGKLIGAHTLGVYSLADDLSRLPMTLLQWPIGVSLYPGFAKVADNAARLAAMFRDGVALITMLTLPFAAGIFVTADSMVRLAFGSNWLEAIPLVQIISLASIAHIPSALANSIFLATNRPQIVAWVQAMRLVVGLPLMLWGAISAGAHGLAWAVVATAAIVSLIRFTMVLRVLELLRLGEVNATIWRTVAASAIMAVGVTYLDGSWPASSSLTDIAIRFATDALSGAAIYTIILLGLWRLSGSPDGAEKHVISFLRSTKWAPFVR